jgi:hypothetical protein
MCDVGTFGDPPEHVLLPGEAQVRVVIDAEMDGEGREAFRAAVKADKGE